MKVGDIVKLKEDFRFKDDYPGVGIITEISPHTHFETRYFVKFEYIEEPVYFHEYDLELSEPYEDFREKIKDRK